MNSPAFTLCSRPLKVAAVLAATSLSLFHCYAPLPIDARPVNTRAVDLPATAVSLLAAQAFTDIHLSNPEGLAIDDAGQLYVADDTGWIFRLSLTGERVVQEKFANTGGYPIGLHFDTEARMLWAANYPLGLQRVDMSGVVTLVLEDVAGEPLAFADDVVVASNGTVYVTDVSTRFNPDTGSESEPFVLWEILEGRPNGRLLAYHPTSNKVEVILDQAFFPSGIALSDDEQSLLFVEVSSNRVMRYWLAGTRRGTQEVFAKDFPGIPDDVYVDEGGRIWVTLVSPRDAFFDKWIQPFPTVKNLLVRLPNHVLRSMEVPQGAGSLLLLSRSGQVQCQFTLTPAASVANVVARGADFYFGVLIGDAPLQATLPIDAPCFKAS